MVEKAGDVEAKDNLQPPFYVKEINSRCPKSHRPLAKKDKEDIYQEPRNEVSKDKDKAKSHNSSTSANQPQTQVLKKNKRRLGGHGGHLVLGDIATKVAKKNKDKAPKDLSHFKCYTFHQKGHYTNKCPKNAKN